MSRYIKRKDTLEIAYGCDDGFGYFFQVFDSTKEADDGLVVNEGFVEGITKERMLELMKQYGMDNTRHLEMIEMNMEI